MALPHGRMWKLRTPGVNRQAKTASQMLWIVKIPTPIVLSRESVHGNVPVVYYESMIDQSASSDPAITSLMHTFGYKAPICIKKALPD